MTGLTITMAFLMGLTGSLHCAGMCGPIVWVIPFQFLNGIKKILGIALYHFGRVSTYAMFAVVLHSFKGLFHPQLQQYISVGLGVILLLLGLISFFPNHFLKYKLPWTQYVQNNIGKTFARRGLSTLLMAGILNGLLPCGLVYMALSASVILNTNIQAIQFMYVFGAGTLPVLIALTLLRSRIIMARALNFRKLIPLCMFLFGCVFVLRGMNLGIPYLSPKVEISQNHIKASCCHKH